MYLLVNEASLNDLNRRLKARGKFSINMDRFRPNIVVTGLEPWQEDCLKKIQIGNVQFHVWQRCGRCTMTTINRETLERGPEPLSTLSTFRERENGMRNFGMHLIPMSPIPNDATVVVGENIKILQYDHECLVDSKCFISSKQNLPRKSKSQPQIHLFPLLSRIRASQSSFSRYK